LPPCGAAVPREPGVRGGPGPRPPLS